MNAIDSHPEYRQLLALSAKVGANATLVQAAGGNTSIKQDDTMWIKASGTWLMHAEREPIMVPVTLTPLLKALHNGDPATERAGDFVDQSRNPAGLRPSIETTVHAALPQRIVVHVHCVNTIAIAIRSDAEQLLAQKLKHFNWLWVPYVRPGLPLAQLIESRKNPATDVIVLGNHGLVIAADSVAAASALLQRVCSALQVKARKAPMADIDALERLAQGSDFQLPPDSGCHATACDHQCLRIAAGGSLYPDHVIFLGAGSAIAETGETTQQVCERYRSEQRAEPPCIHFPTLGTLLHKSANASVQAMALCLADVTARVTADAPINYLTEPQNHQLLNWDAEQYRQSMAGKQQ